MSSKKEFRIDDLKMRSSQLFTNEDILTLVEQIRDSIRSRFNRKCFVETHLNIARKPVIFRVKNHFVLEIWFDSLSFAFDIHGKEIPIRMILIEEIFIENEKERFNGIGTEIILELEEIARENQYDAIFIQNVIDNSLMHICKKIGFITAPGSFLIGERFYGSYIKYLKENISTNYELRQLQ